MVARALVLAAAFAMSACNDGRHAQSPTTPTETQPATPQPPAAISQAATMHLDAVLRIMESDSVNKVIIDWSSLRTEVFTAAAAAQSIRDTYPGISVALRSLNDYESYYVPRDGGIIGPPPVGGCRSATPTAGELPPNVGYVRIGSCPCDGTAATQFAESVQQAIKTADRPGLAGWIVDLRGNFGGNMWPMIAGVGPLVGEGIIGWIVYNNREYEREYRAGAAQSFGDVFARVNEPYTLMRQDPRVAVLTDDTVVSAAEAITVFFRGRPDTRSFGIRTCGHHHLLQQYSLNDGASLFLVTAQSADRTKRRYGGPIDPDEVVADADEAFRRAVAWVQSGR